MYELQGGGKTAVHLAKPGEREVVEHYDYLRGN
jgi:hypothetical protein